VCVRVQDAKRVMPTKTLLTSMITLPVSMLVSMWERERDGLRYFGRKQPFYFFIIMAASWIPDDTLCVGSEPLLW
jgi:hypothetical protein